MNIGTILSKLITAIIFLAAVAVVLMASPPVHASGCYSSGCTNPTPTETPTSTSSSDKTYTLGQLLLVAAVLACPIVAVYTRIAEGRWTWCGGDEEKKELPPDPGPAVKSNDVTPDLPQPDQLFMIQGR